MTISNYNNLLYQWRWPILIGTVLISLFAGSGGRFITFSSDYQVFFDDSNEQLEAFELLQNTYAKSDNVLIVLLPKSNNIFEKNTLEAIGVLTEKSWQLPYSSRVDSLTNYSHSYGINDDLIVEDLIENFDELDQASIDRAKNISLNEPLLVKRLISDKGDVSAVNITVQMPEGNEDAVREVINAARNIITEMETLYPNIDFALTGVAALSNAFSEAAQRDITTLVPAMFLLIILILGFLLRSISATIGVVLVIFLSIISAMGIFGWMGNILSPPTTSIPIIIMTVAVADSVHVLIGFFHGLRSGLSKKEAMEQALTLNFKAILVTSITTIFGFLTMNFSEVPPIRETGTTVAIGVAFAFFLSVFFLPAFMHIVPVKAKPKTSTRLTFIERYAEFLIRHKTPMFAGSIIVSLIFLAAIPLNRINDEFIKYFHTNTDFRQDTDLVSKRLSGIYTIAFSLEAAESGGINDPAFIKELDQFAQWLKQKNEVEHVYTISDTFKRLNKNMHSDDESYYRIPDNKELAAQYLLLYEMSLPYGLDLNDQINIDKSSVRLIATLKNIPSYKTLEIEKMAQDWLNENANFHAYYATSPNVMFSHIGSRNTQSIIKGSLIALLLISLLMIIVLRSIKLGIVSIIPNLLPIGIAFGVWGIINGNLGFSLISAIGITLGIVVDDTVHFLVKYRLARAEKAMLPADAVRYAFSNVGLALFVTTFVLVSGFLVLASSTFLMNAQQGIFTATTIGVALILDFVFLPTLLLLIEEKKNETKTITV